MEIPGLDKAVYGITKAEALAQSICINCKMPAIFTTQEGRAEYPISGLCEPCFDNLFAEDKEETSCPLKLQPDVVMTSSNFSADKFDCKYDFSCIKSERAFEEARIMGEVVVLPAADELQIDIDNAADYGVYLENSERLTEHICPMLYATETPSRHKGEGKHITVKLGREIDDEKRIMLQLFLGSDRVREMLSYVRLLNDDPHPTLFIEKKPQALLTEGNNGNS